MTVMVTVNGTVVEFVVAKLSVVTGLLEVLLLVPNVVTYDVSIL